MTGSGFRENLLDPVVGRAETHAVGKCVEPQQAESRIQDARPPTNQSHVDSDSGSPFPVTLSAFYPTNRERAGQPGAS